MQKFYDLGFQDATNGVAHGTSIGDLKEALASDKNTDYINPLSEIFSLTTLASLFYMYKSAMELGMDQSTNLFSIGQLAANIQHQTEWWTKALLCLSIYNLLRIFLFWY